MCRILALHADSAVDPRPFVRAFAERCRASREFQGHGWGVSWWEDGAWRSRHALEPIWSDPLPDLPPSALLLCHARSAFRNEGIVVENNMPFTGDGLAFAFNGELRGVRLQAPGDTGAWRLFHLLRRFHRTEGGGLAALERLDSVVTARTRYVRALNVVTSDGEGLQVNARWSEDPAYFTLWRARLGRTSGNVTLVSSERFEVRRREGIDWAPIPNGSTLHVGEAAACWS
jgi:glutamine amidotransferase